MTAEETYAETRKAMRDYVLENIKASARNCRFEVRIWHTYLYKELEDELIACGYTLSRGDNQVIISWNVPKKKRFQQSEPRVVTFD